MADARRVLAVIYREASNGHHCDSIEWHALREVSLLLESHAVSNITAARLHETRFEPAQKGDA